LASLDDDPAVDGLPAVSDFDDDVPFVDVSFDPDDVSFDPDDASLDPDDVLDDSPSDESDAEDVLARPFSLRVSVT
jgi:hypothetical protein